MNIETKCKIMSMAWGAYSLSADEGWGDLFAMYDLAYPFAFGVTHGLVTLTDTGINQINEGWVAMCDIMNVDPDADYVGYDDWIDASPNPVI